MNCLVSVIIPVYNMENFINECVDSVISQSYSNVEIILVNDGSTDNSLIICEEISQKNQNVILISQENQGVSAARNAGMDVSKGDFIVFLDADDTLPPDAITQLMDAAIKNKSDMAIGKISPKEQIPIGTFAKEDFLFKCLEDNPITYYSVRTLYKREFLQGVTFEKGFISGEDSYFMFTCALKMPTVVTINECVYSYTINTNSATRSKFSLKKYNSICELLNKKEAIVINDFPHLLELFYHLKTKIQMMLLSNLARVKGNEFKDQENETWSRFNSYKSYFRADLLHSNVALYNLLVKYGYKKYKIYTQFKLLIKRIAQKT